jgi:hypothetical protein
MLLKIWGHKAVIKYAWVYRSKGCSSIMNYLLGMFILRHISCYVNLKIPQRQIFMPDCQTLTCCVYISEVFFANSHVTDWDFHMQTFHWSTFIHYRPLGGRKLSESLLKSVLQYRLKYTFHLLLFIVAIFCSLFVNVNSDTRHVISADSVANRKQHSKNFPMLSYHSAVAKDNYVRYRNKNWFSVAIRVITNLKQKAVAVHSNLSLKRCCIVYVWREYLAQIAAPANAQCYCTRFTITVNLQKVYYWWRKACLRKLIHKVTSFQFPRSLCTYIFNIYIFVSMATVWRRPFF